MRLVIADTARADLRSIKRFSAQEWGEERGARYMAAVQQRFSALLRHPDLGPARTDLGAGYRSLLVGSHVVFYRHDKEIIEIVRVLHQRMDAKRHLPE